MPLSYDDDNLPAIEPGAPPAAAAPAKRGKLVFDAAPAAAPAPAAPAAAPTTLLNNPVVGGAEDLYHHVTGTLAQIPATVVGGVAGLAQTLGAPVDAEALRQKTQNLFTAQPVTESGKAGLATEAAALKPVGDVVNAGLEKTGPARPYVEAVGRGASAALAAAPFAAPVADAVEAVGSKIASTGLEAPKSPALVEGAAKPSTATPLQTSRGAGYQAPPSVVQASNPAESIPGTTRESIVGPSGIRADANVKNQTLTTQLAGKEIGVPNATKISADDAANFRKTGPGPKYDTVAEKLGYMAPDTAATDALTALSEDQNPASALPPKARQNVNRIAAKISDGGYTGKDWIKDVSWLRENGARDAANELEDMAQRHLTAKGDTETLALHRGARQDFAKSYDIQNAIGRGGQIDAHQLLALDDKYPGLLTGNLKVIATAARELPEVTRLPGADTGPGVHTKLQAVHNAVGGVIKRLPGMNPMSESFQSAKFGREMSPTEQSYVPSFGAKNQGPLTERPTDPTGGLTLAPDSGAGGTATPRGEGIPLADVLSTGVEKPAPLGLSLSPMGAPAPQGIPFSRNAEHMAGDLSLADAPPRRLGEALSDVAGVRSQGVPEDIAARTAPAAKLRSKDSVPYRDDVIPLGQSLTKRKKRGKD